MLEFYTLSLETYHNDQRVGRDSSTILIDESEAPDFDCVTDLNWENLDFVYPACGLMLPFNIWNTKKGRLVSFFNCSGNSINPSCQFFQNCLSNLYHLLKSLSL